MIWDKELRRELAEVKARNAALEEEKQRLLDRIMEMSGQKPLYAPVPEVVEVSREEPTPIAIVAKPAAEEPEAPSIRSLSGPEVIQRAMDHRSKHSQVAK